MVVLALALSSGILFSAIFISTSLAFLIAIVVAGVALLASIVCFVANKPLIAIVLLIFVLGFGSYTLDYHLTNPKELIGETFFIEGRIDQVGADKPNGSTFYLETVRIDGQATRGRVQLVSGDYVRVSVGQYFSGYAQLEHVAMQPFDTVAMSFDRYDVRYRGSVGSYYNITIGGKLSLSEKVRERIANALDSVLNRDQRGVAESLLFGDRAYLDAEDYQAIKTSGLAHIFSVSGLHVGFLVVVLMWLCKKCRIAPAISGALIVVALFGYQALCGYSPTIMRAIVMTIVLLLSRLTYRRVDALTSLATAIIALELINPSTLFDIGYLMSVGSIAGIIMFATPIYRALRSKIKLNKLSLSVGTSIGANAGLLPIMTNVFGTFNPYFIIANFVVLPMVTLLFILLIVGAFAGALVPALAVLLYPSKYLIIALLAISQIISSLPYANITVASMGLLAVCYYAFLVVISRYTMLEKPSKLKLSILLAIITLIVAVVMVVLP